MKKANTLGVIVGRFQTPYLHAGHVDFLDFVSQSSHKLLVVIGYRVAFAGVRDPLDFETRRQMILKAYPQAVVEKIHDNPCDIMWTEKLEEIIAKHREDLEPVLYGSRSSFLPHYHGTFQTLEYTPRHDICATSVRGEVTKTPRDTEDFRAGVIYAAHKNFPTSFQAVDMIIEHTLEAKVLVGRKVGHVNWCFPGGFVDPSDESLEQAGKREVREECGGIEIDDVKYLGSHRVNDFRYRNSEHKIMTALFVAKYIFGPLKAGDDLAEIRWQPIGDLVDCLQECHKPLAEAYLKHKQSKQ